MPELPDWYWQIPYDGSHFPGGVPRSAVASGANCQLFAYEVLAHFGFAIPDLRSSELWEDTVATTAADDPQPLDLVLFSKDQESYGAHVGVVWGPDAILHLCKEVGRPVIWSMADFAQRDRYQVVLGYRRPILTGSRRG